MKNTDKKTPRIYLIILALFFSLAPVTSLLAQKSEDINSDFPARQKDLETAQEVVNAYEAGDWQTLRNNVTADAYFYNLGSYDSLNLEQTVSYWKKGRETATPVLSKDGVWLPVEVKTGPRKGEWVLHWGNNTLSYPNGETINFPYHVAMKFNGDKINQAYFYYDNNRIIRALGYDIQPPINDDDEEYHFPEQED